MSDQKCKSLVNLLPRNTSKFSPEQLPNSFESYRHELHHEMANAWPMDSNASNTAALAPAASKSAAPSSTAINHPPTAGDALPQTLSHIRSTNLILPNPNGNLGKRSEMPKHVLGTDSEMSLKDQQQPFEWNLKAQENILVYPLPDGLVDGVALHDKLQKLMKTNTIYLNDRRFWATLENRFKKMRKQSFHQNMERLRRKQQQYEQELISKGLIPFTAEDAIRQHAEQQRTQLRTNQDQMEKATCKNYLIDDVQPENPHRTKLDENDNDELAAFESDNVHPCFREICPDYKFQSETAENMGKKFERDLHQAQLQMKTIFPKTSPCDTIRRELDAVKTSEGLYAYSTRVAKQLLK